MESNNIGNVELLGRMEAAVMQLLSFRRKNTYFISGSFEG